MQQFQDWNTVSWDREVKKRKMKAQNNKLQDYKELVVDWLQQQIKHQGINKLSMLLIIVN